MLPRLFALDCFTMIRMPFYQMGHQYTVVHGIGPENTGAHYVRGNFKTRPDDLDIWKSLGYLWTDVVSSDDVVPVLRFCRDTLTLPDHIHLLEEEYNAVMIKDSKITNDRPRWLEIFQFIYGDTTHQDDGFFRLAVISPGCSSLTMENCTTKDIIKLAQMGLVVVDGKYNCFVEKPAPEDEHLPLYTFNNEVRVEDVVDSGIQTTLVSDHKGGEIAIVMVLGRVHLLRRDTHAHNWHLVNRVGSGGSKQHALSLALEKVLLQMTGPVLNFGYVKGKVATLPIYRERRGTQPTHGYMGDC